MNVKTLLILTALFASPAFAFDDADATSARLTLITSFNEIIIIFGFLVGLCVFIAGCYKLTLVTIEGTKNAYSAPAVYVLAGVIMMNLSPSLSVLTNTFFSVDFCTLVENNAPVSSCFSNELSGVTGELQTRIEKLSGASTAEKFFENIQVIIGIFQVIGFIYFLVGAHGLTEVARGSAQHGYGKPIITMIAAALIVDIPHTASVFLSTLEKIGINF
ncbi:hypothetical protein PX74_003756 [Salmonella enterica subsp. enterica]|nr:hypothetical protein [Salmonella enterica subsp. enterica]